MLAPIDGLTGTQFRSVLAVGVFVAGVMLGYLVGRVNRRLLYAMDVDDAVEGTTVERLARRGGSIFFLFVTRRSTSQWMGREKTGAGRATIAIAGRCAIAVCSVMGARIADLTG